MLGARVREKVSPKNRKISRARSYIRCLPIIFSFLWTDVVVIIVVVVGGSVVCNVACGISGERFDVEYMKKRVERCISIMNFHETTINLRIRRWIFVSLRLRLSNKIVQDIMKLHKADFVRINCRHKEKIRKSLVSKHTHMNTWRRRSMQKRQSRWRNQNWKYNIYSNVLLLCRVPFD